MGARIHGIENEAQARRALDEIERLIADADATGVRLDPWVAELAEELRAVVPVFDADTSRRLADRIKRSPNLFLAAQGKMRPEIVRVLRP